MYNTFATTQTRRQRSPRRATQRRRNLESLEPRQLLAADVVINEVMFNAVTGQDADEWLELYNAGDEAADLTGHRIASGVSFDFPAVELEAGEFLVVAADVDQFSATYPDVTNVIGGWTGRLSNRAEEISLEDADGEEVDRAKYADSGDWAERRQERNGGVNGWTWVSPHDGEGRSIELRNPALPHVVGHNWAPSKDDGGTPGAANSTASDDIAPAIWDVSHTPVIPTSADDVTITAHVIDESPGVTATLFYRESQAAPQAFTEIPMHDDGAHGDGEANDGIFGATLPPHADNAVVEFYVRSTDAQSKVRTSPGVTDDEGGQDANMLYQVDDAVRNHDVALYRSIMTVADRESFAQHNRFSDAQMNATFIATVGGETEFRYNAGVRYRGSGTRTNNPANNRINLPSDRAWNGTTRLNINSQSPRSQVAGSAMASLAGVAAADATAVRMLSNNVDLSNGRFYAHVEVLTGDWADKHFPLDSQGNVYRGRRANEGPPGGQGAGLRYFGEDQSPYVSYLKGSNRSQADYSDVVRLTDVLNNSPDETFLEDVHEVLNVEQWMRTIAMIDLSGYGEFGLLTGDGQGDDYAMYRGVNDSRFIMVPYDLDSMFEYTGALLRAESVPALRRLLGHPEIRATYYRQVFDLMENSYQPDRVRAVLDQMLGAVEAEARIDNMMRYLERRFDSVRNMLPAELAVTSGDDVEVDEQRRTSSDVTGTLSGTAHIAHTTRVEVGGETANWDFRQGTWSIAGVPLEPGLNWLTVQAFDADDNLLDETTIRYWRDREQPATSVNEDIAGDVVWTKSGSPYQISGNVTIAADASLTVEPGTQIEFGNQASLTVQGRLDLAGSAEEPILVTRVPGSAGSWAGIQYRNTQQANRIQHAVLQHARTIDGMIGLQSSQIEIDNVTFAHSPLRRIRSIGSSLVVRNSNFTAIAPPGTAPETDNLSEHIWGNGIPADGQWLLENNSFGHITGHNDGIDFDAPRLPNAIPVIRNNVFHGGGDDALDMTGDVWIEGNLFRNYIKDEFNVDPGESNTISSSSGTFYVVRNVFENVQHAALVKENAFMHFLNNTVTNSQGTPLYFDLPGQTDGPGRGARVDGSIFDSEILYDYVRAQTELTTNYSRVPDLNDPNVVGDGNTDLPAELQPVAPFHPRPGSIARGNGRGGLHMGADVPTGAVVVTQPQQLTSSDRMTLQVAGAGITQYRYQLDDGDWSEPRPIDEAIELSGLADGEHLVRVVGQNLIGDWQADADANESSPWTVDSTLSGVRINELMANNQTAVDHEGTRPDLVELFNLGRESFDLSGMSLTDDPEDPSRFVFPAGTTIDGGGYLVLFADANESTSGIHLGFALSSNGEGLYLYDAQGDLVDSVEFGVQPTDFSIGVGHDQQWGAVQPSFGSPNVNRFEDDGQALQINEWLAAPKSTRSTDFFELHNTSAGPVDLAGMRVTDTPISWPDRHSFPELSYVDGFGFTAFVADGDPEDGKHHVDFRLSSDVGRIALSSPDGTFVHWIQYGNQQPDLAVGAVPDGSFDFTTISLPTPGLPNEPDSVSVLQLVASDAEWSFDQSGTELGTDWREPDFDDTAWERGQAALFAESATLPVPKNTPIELGRRAYYFRSEFNLENASDVTEFSFRLLIDDGAVVYVNGTEVHRIGMPDGPIDSRTLANRTVGNANFEGPFTIPSDALMNGRNVIAVEVHQSSDGSSDVVFALDATATTRKPDPAFASARQLFNGLRITELMYNPLGGGDFEFVEFQNVSDVPVNLAGVRLTGGIDFTFPDLELGPEEFTVVASNADSFRERYGNNALIAGEFNRALANGGEEIILDLPEPYDISVLRFTYDDDWHPTTDGDGFSLVVDDPRQPTSTLQTADAWRSSNFLNGSPGFEDAGLDLNILRINEILAYTSEGTAEQIEIVNTTNSNLDLGGWYLSDDPSSLTKYEIPAATIVEGGRMISFSSDEDFGGAFSLDDVGGVVVLSSPDAIGDTAGFVVMQAYGTTEINTTQGRYVRSDGIEDFAEQAEITIGDVNPAPEVNAVVISEVAFAPFDGDEFIELYNRSNDPVNLHSRNNENVTWSLRGAVNFDFPPAQQLNAGEYMIIVGGDPELFRAAHDVPAGVTILGPYQGVLDNSGDDLELVRPSDDFANAQIVVERLQYGTTAPWPVEPIDGIATLIRSDVAAYANDPVHWRSGIAGGTPGEVNLGIDTSPPTAPTDVQSELLEGPAVQLSWQAAEDPETGILQYRVLRDGVEIGQTETPLFVDPMPPVPAELVYEVIAVNGQTTSGPSSSPHLVQVVGAEAFSRFATQLVVQFSTPMDRDSAERVENYQIDGFAIQEATLSDDGRTLSLTTTEMPQDVPLSLVVNDVISEAGQELAPNFNVPFSFQEGTPGFAIEARASRARIRNFEHFDEVLAQPEDSTNLNALVTDIFPFINFVDDEESYDAIGRFDGKIPFPTDEPGNENNFIIDANGFLLVDEDQAGPWTFAVNMAPTSQSVSERVVLPKQSEWRYLDDGSDQGTAWTQPNFDDADWAVGRGQFGYGDGDEQTTISFGDNADDKHVTTYFRSEFFVDDPSAVTAAAGTFLRDDGGAIYVNGIEVTRHNLVPDAGFDRFANGEVDTLFENLAVSFDFDPSILVAGRNVIAAEVHQSSADGEDLGFDIEVSLEQPDYRNTDGAKLIINGEAILHADTGNTSPDRIGSVNLGPGAHAVNFQFFEAIGEAEIELMAAPGSYSNIGQTDDWRLVGDHRGGGLRIVSDPLPPQPLIWQRLGPDGSGIRTTTVSTELKGGDVPATFGSSFSAQQRLSAAISAKNPSATVTVRVRNGLQTIANVTTTGGTPASLDNIRLPADGDYTLEVASDIATQITIDAFFNAMQENESVTANDDFNQAHSLAEAREAIADDVDRYALIGTTDAAGTPDHFSVPLQQGQQVSIAMQFDSVAGGDLVLLNDQGDTVAVAIQSNAFATIADFIAPTTGDYVVRVAAAEPTEYALSLAVNAGIGTRSNQNIDTAAPFSIAGQHIGFLGGAGGTDPIPGSGAAVTFPVEWIDSEGFRWDYQEFGDIGDGTNDAYDGGLRPDVFYDSTTAVFEEGDRELVIGPTTDFNGATHFRKVFVPSDGGFARYLEIVTNETSTPISTVVGVSSNFGSDGATQVAATASGDLVVDASDFWIVTDDNNGSGDPTLMHMFYGPNARQQPTSVALEFQDNLRFQYTLNLEPGETQIIMHFAAQNTDQATAIGKATSLVELPALAVSGLSPEEADHIVNFDIPDARDWYATHLSADVPTTFNALPIGSSANPLQLQISVLDPLGNPIPVPDDAPSDQITFTPTASGIHHVLVESTSGRGDYILRSGGVEIQPAGVSVDTTSPSVGSLVDGVPAEITVHLTAAVDASSIDATAVTLNGVSASDATVEDGNSISFHFPVDQIEFIDTIDLAIMPGAFQGYAGTPVNEFSATYFVDDQPPQIIASSIADLHYQNVLPGALNFFVTFDEPLNEASIDTTDVYLADPETGNFVFFASFLEYDAATSTVNGRFDFLPEGVFQLTVTSGDHAFEDLAGNDLDGELQTDGSVGDGIAGGNLEVVIRIENPPVDLTRSLQQAGSREARVTSAEWNETIAHADDVDTYEIILLPGETLEAAVTSLTGQSLSLEIRDPWARPVRSLTQAASTTPLTIDGIHSATGGKYQLQVSGDLGANYRLQVIKNGELESVDTSALNPLPLDLFADFAGVSQVAAMGTADVILDPSVLVWGVQPMSGQIVIVEPRTGAIAGSFPAPGNLLPSHENIGLTTSEAGHTLLYINSDDQPDTIYRLDPFTGAVLDEIAIQPGAYNGLGYNEGHLFLNSADGGLTRITLAGDPPIPNWMNGANGAVAADDTGKVYVANNGSIQEVDPHTPSQDPLSTVTPTAAGSVGLAFDGRSLYASTNGGDLHTIPTLPNSAELPPVKILGGPLYGLAAISTTAAVSVGSPPIAEIEPNNSRNSAQNIDGTFGTGFDPNIGDADDNTSFLIPHTTVRGQGNGTRDYYAFTVLGDDVRGIFDIDNTTSGFDSHLRVFTLSGTLLAENDDSSTTQGQGGSTSGLDSFVEYTFTEPGVYVVEVGSCCVGDVPSDATYDLHVSLTNPLRNNLEWIASGSEWRYLDTGVEPQFWTSPAALFDDSSWNLGRGEFGYGDGGEQTTVSFGPDATNKHVTTLFRKEFTVYDLQHVEEVWVELLRDDAAAVYLNGRQIISDGLPALFDQNTLATGDPIEGAAESEFVRFSLDADLLREGSNILAAEVHQHALDDEDMSFDLRLRGLISGTDADLPLAPDNDAYHVDLSPFAGRAIDITLVGQGGANFSNESLRLLNRTGDTTLATASNEFNGVALGDHDLMIRDFVVPETGRYFLTLDSNVPGDYVLAVTDAVVDSEPNEMDAGVTRPLPRDRRVLGHLSPRFASSVMDPQDDSTVTGNRTFDMTRVEAAIDGESLVLTVDFSTPITSTTGDNGVFLYFELDTDQDPFTGTDAFQNGGIVPGQDGGPLGVEYAVQIDLNFGSGFVVDTLTQNVTDQAQFVFSETSVTTTVPLAALGMDDGEINLGVLSIGNNRVADAAPDDSFLTTSAGGNEDQRSHDTYHISMSPGETFFVSTETLPDTRGQGADLDLSLELRDAEGNVVASNAGQPSDGNAAVVYTAENGGMYEVVVNVEEGDGGYTVQAETIAPNQVLGEFLFYNNSLADGLDPGLNEADDSAIAADKRALRPNQPAGFQHYASSTQGINGVMIDILGANGPLGVDDFSFRVGNSDQIDAWSDAPSPLQVATRGSAGVAGSDRVAIRWNDGTIVDSWLEVTVHANANTGLAEPHVFYFGNLVGDSGDHIGRAEVTTIDELGTAQTIGEEVASSFVFGSFDFDLDGVVTPNDVAITKQNSRRALAPVFPGQNPIDDPPSRYGDTNLDGVFDAEDLVAAYRHGEFEDELDGNSTWAEGDWDGDGDFTTLDLVFAFTYGFFEHDLPNANPEELIQVRNRPLRYSVQ